MRDEFAAAYGEVFTDGGDTAKLDALYQKLDLGTHSEGIDYVAFVDNLKLEDLPELVSKCRTAGPLSEARRGGECHGPLAEPVWWQTHAAALATHASPPQLRSPRRSAS